MPIYFPTEDQFKNPIVYIESLVNGKENINQYGCVKIVPPKNFRPPLAIDINSDRKLPTRFQIL